MARLLLIFAHPDDEAFLVAGTALLNKRAGGDNFLICATRGEEGEISHPSLATVDTIGAVREAELCEACEAAGIEPPIFLDYRDSGMNGTDANTHPDAFVMAPDVEVIARLVAEIRRLQPDVVVTFDPAGLYGHPDHLKAHDTAVRAFHLAADPTQLPESGEPWQATRLYFGTVPREAFLKRMRDRGRTIETDSNGAQLLPGTPEDEITTQIDTSSVVNEKIVAWAAHRTQHPYDPDKTEPSQDNPTAWFSGEHFVRAYPLQQGLRENSLTDGL